MSAQLHASAALLKQRRASEAALLLDRVLERAPDAVEARLMYAQIEQQRGRYAAMLECTRRAVEFAPRRPDVLLMHVHALMCNGETAAGLATLRDLASSAPADATLATHIAEAFTRYGRHREAQPWYRRAVQLRPQAPGYLFNLATSLQASGEFAAAETLLDEVLQHAPNDGEACGMRSGLRRQTLERNHVADLEARLARVGGDAQQEMHLCYALAKELEDLGEYARAFVYLQRGASKRRERLAYRVEGDVLAMRRIGDAYSAAFFTRDRCAHEELGPIFVTGLPRSGTTLVDRILSSHSAVESLGEISDFAQALTALAGGGGKMALIEASTRIDFAALGARYCRSARGYGVASTYFIDKSPHNFLYLGLIQQALPNARVLHIARHPMDACFGMYKTLFRMGYPFSYNFDDLAQYYAAYQRLMAHWRAVLPRGWFLDVSYEELVAQPTVTTQRILDFCGLEFEPQCLEFHRNPAPVATASSVQVRRPINQDAVARWRRYERQLEPLQRALVAAGVQIT